MNCGHKWGVCLLLHRGHQCVLAPLHHGGHQCACGAPEDRPEDSEGG